MSEQLIQKLLDIGGCGAETEWAQGYDDGVNAAKIADNLGIELW